MIELNSLKAAMQDRLDSYRFSHTCSVADEVMQLAALFRMSEKERQTLCAAALLHDCTKGLSYDEQIVLAKRLGVYFSEDDLASPKVLHSLTGAALAVAEFGADRAISDMIACHTTGKEDMSLSEKLLYLADYIEPTRAFEDCRRLRSFFYEDHGQDLPAHLNAALIYSFDLTLNQLIAEKSFIHPKTVKSRNFLLKNA